MSLRLVSLLTICRHASNVTRRVRDSQGLMRPRLSGVDPLSFGVLSSAALVDGSSVLQKVDFEVPTPILWSDGGLALCKAEYSWAVEP